MATSVRALQLWAVHFSRLFYLTVRPQSFTNLSSRKLHFTVSCVCMYQHINEGVIASLEKKRGAPWGPRATSIALHVWASAHNLSALWHHCVSLKMAHTSSLITLTLVLPEALRGFISERRNTRCGRFWWVLSVSFPSGEASINRRRADDSHQALVQSDFLFSPECRDK